MILQVFWTIRSVSNIMLMGKLFSMSLNQMARVSLLLKKIKRNMSGKHFHVLNPENCSDVLEGQYGKTLRNLGDVTYCYKRGFCRI